MNQSAPDGAGRTGLLEQAERQAEEHRLNEYLVVDADAHIRESLAAVVPYLDEPFRQRVAAKAKQEWYVLPYDLGEPGVGSKAGRIPSDGGAAEVARSARRIGVDLSILYPTEMLHLGLSPQAGMEAALAEGYAKWMIDAVLPQQPSLKAMLYLPFSDPDACLRLVEGYSGHPGVAGFLVTSVRHDPVHHNRYARLYHALSERGQVLAFHPEAFWRDRQFEVFNQLASVHALSLPFYNMVHLINIVTHGLPERYPGIRWLFCEAGVSWLCFMMHRLNNEYMMRPSEAPVLTRKPGEYIRDFYFTTQPLERIDEPEHLSALMDMVGTSQLLYASNFPRWDFEGPARIMELPFLGDEARRDILGRNAARLFQLEEASLRATAG